jgi:tyrosinase
MAAAINLRLPYWDWAMDVPSGGNSMPDFVSKPTISVTTPNGTQTIANPLYSYKFLSNAGRQGLYWYPFTSWNQTYRWPTTSGPGATTNVASLNGNLNSMQMNNKQRIYAMFTGNGNFTEVGTNPYISSSANAYDNFESVHDQVHVGVGGSNNGDMTIIAVSAFDPSFWLHHS